MIHLSALCGALVTLASCADYRCPDKHYRQYADERQCDKYYECEDGVSTEHLCPDGLVFDPTIKTVNKCNQPFHVDCEDRNELQPAISTELCPRRNGYFAHPDPSQCHVFYSCIEGKSHEITCPNGLHFDEFQGICVWAKNSDRQGCSNKPAHQEKGFTCPTPEAGDRQGRTQEHPVFAHPEDCRLFYVCLNGVTAREQGCSPGEVFNEESGLCDRPENVPGCEDWYKDHPEHDVKKPNKKTA